MAAMETLLTAMTVPATVQKCRIVLRDIGNVANNNGTRKRTLELEDEKENSDPKRLRTMSGSGDSGIEEPSLSDENVSRYSNQSGDDDDELISEVIYSKSGGVTYAVKCNLSENCAANEAEITGGQGEVITVDGLKTYIQLESSPRIHKAAQVIGESESDPPANDAGFESETESEEECVSSSNECPAVMFEISVPVSPAPIPIPMPKQFKERRWRYRGLNQNLRRIFGEHRKIDTTPKTLQTLKLENLAADQKFPPKFSSELMGRKPSPRFVALTAPLKLARGKKDHRNHWIPTCHVDLRKNTLLNGLMSDFAEKRAHYEGLCEAVRGTQVTFSKSIDHCIIEEISCVDPNSTWQELRSNAFQAYMSPGGQGHERRQERLTKKRQAKAERAEKRRRRTVEQSHAGLDFDPSVFFSRGEAGLRFQVAESA